MSEEKKPANKGFLESAIGFLHRNEPQFIRDDDEKKFLRVEGLRADLVAKKEALKNASDADKNAIQSQIEDIRDTLRLYSLSHWNDTDAERLRHKNVLARSRVLAKDYERQTLARQNDISALLPVKAEFEKKEKALLSAHKTALKKARSTKDGEAVKAENKAYLDKLAAIEKDYADAASKAAPEARKHLLALETDRDASRLARVSYKKNLVDEDVILSVRHMKQFFDMGGGYKTKAVHDVSFDIKRNECFGLVGESGCGKTTTGRCIIKLYDITSGAVYYEGYRISGGVRFNEKEIKWSRIHTKEKIKALREKERVEIASIPLKSTDIVRRLDDLNAAEKAEIEERADPNDVDRDDLILSIRNDYARQRAELESLKTTASMAESKQASNIRSYYENEIKTLCAKERIHVQEQREEIKHIKYDNKHANKLMLPDGLPEDANMAKVQRQPNHRLVNEIQMIFQDPVDSLDPRMTVNDIIQEGLRIQGKHNVAENERKVADILNKVGLIPEYASRYPHEFSGGQRQRIGIARSIVMNPKFLICDEPISALDVSIRAQILNLLNDVKDEMGVSILFIAHDLSVVKYFCDRIAVMYYGNLVELATSDELFKHPLHPYTKSLLSAIPKPDPASEKNRVRIVYKPSEVHDYSHEKPSFQEILPGHFVLANAPEMAKYRQEIVVLDEKAKAKEK
jgi:oligopeptide transport system ATP-binding protein